MMLLRKFDCLRRAPRDVSTPSLSGSVVSIVTLVLMLAFVYAQIGVWMTPSYRRTTSVSRAGSDDSIMMYMNITFLYAPCSKIKLTVLDSFIKKNMDLTGHLHKEPEGDGCKIHADFWVKKNKGEFFFSSVDDMSLKMDHSIQEFRIGDIHPLIPGLHEHIDTSYNTMNGLVLRKIGNSSHDYNLKLLMTGFDVDGNGTFVFPYQYTFSYKPHLYKPEGKRLPKFHFIRFRYNWSPLLITYRTHYSTLYNMMFNIVSQCGGLFTAAGILHRAGISGTHFIKAQMNKKL